MKNPDYTIDTFIGLIDFWTFLAYHDKEIDNDIKQIALDDRSFSDFIFQRLDKFQLLQPAFDEALTVWRKYGVIDREANRMKKAGEVWKD